MQITADLLRSKFGFNDINVINNILKNPDEVKRYNRELNELSTPSRSPLNTSTTPSRSPLNTSTANATAAFNAAQAAKEQDFLSRFRTAISEARTALESELGLGGLRSNALAAGDTARNVQGQFGAIAPTQQTIAKQVGISAPRLQQRISSKSAELAPALSAASSSLEGANQALQSGLNTYGTRMQENILPYSTEASVLSDSLAREMTGFSTNLKSELDITLEKLKQQGTLDLAEIAKATKLAELEQQYLNQRQVINLGGSQSLINPITGQTISSYQNTVKPTTGTLATGW